MADADYLVNGYAPLFPILAFDVEAIFSVHYFEYASDYIYPGESHDFWEFCYVDKGEIEIESTGIRRVLAPPEIIFHKPGEFHSLRANGNSAPNLVVASFSCSSPAMSFFENKLLRATNYERTLMARILDEAAEAFLSPLNDPDLKHLVRRATADGCHEQMIRNCLENLLISLYRGGNRSERPTSLIRENDRQAQMEGILDYFEQNIHRQLTLDEVCSANLVGRSHLQKLFNQKTGGGAMEYFIRMKVEAAKRMIRESRQNFTEIAEALGYSSIHYFSRQFKKVTGMTPSEYATSVKSLSDNDRLR